MVTRAHKTLIWERTRHALRLRYALRDYFPATLEAFADLDAADSLELLAKAPDPASAARLSIGQISAALKRARRRNVAEEAAHIQTALRAGHLGQPDVVTTAYVATTRTAVARCPDACRELRRHQPDHPRLGQATSRGRAPRPRSSRRRTDDPRHSPRSSAHPVHTPTTTVEGAKAPSTTPRSDDSPIGSSRSSTDASRPRPSTTSHRLVTSHRAIRGLTPKTLGCLPARTNSHKSDDLPPTSVSRFGDESTALLKGFDSAQSLSA